MTTQTAPSADKRSVLLAGFITGLFLLFLAEVLVGAVLELRYSPSIATAHANVVAIQASDAALLHGFHYWASALLIAGSITALGWMVFARWFNGGHNRIWLATALLFLTSLLSQITGNLLPLDHHGVRTAVVEAGVARSTPFIGPQIARAALAGNGFNDATPTRWHAGHIAFLGLGLIALVAFATAIRAEPKSKAAALAPTALGLVGALAFSAPLGHAATTADYASYEAQVSWYTWPLHGSLNLWSNLNPSLSWIGSALLPGLFAAFIVSAPWIARRVAAKIIQGAFAAFLLYFLIAAIGFGGRFAPLVGTRDPAITATSALHSEATPADPILVAQGRQIFNTNACAGCHGKDGRNGTSGPDLLDVAKRRGTDPTWYVKFIRDPQTEKPNSMMPPFHELSDQERRALAEFLIHPKR